MRITQETDYAIRIILLCGENNSSKLSGNFIIENCDLPERWGKRILTKLCKHRILKSSKGKNGGFELGKCLKEMTLYDIFFYFEEIDFQSNEKIEEYRYKQKLENLKNNFIETLKNTIMFDLLENTNSIYIK